MALFNKLLDGVKKFADDCLATLDGSETTTSEVKVYVDPLHNEALDRAFVKYLEHYRSYKEECIREYRYSHFIDAAFEAYYSSPVAGRNYELIDNIPQDLKETQYYRNKLVELMDTTFSQCAKRLKEGTINVTHLYRMVGDLAHFEEFKGLDLEKVLVHKDYFSSEFKAARSVLDPKSPVREQLDQILKKGQPQNLGAFVGIQENIEHALTDKIILGNQLSDEQADNFLVMHHLFSTMTSENLDELKQAILYLALEDDRGILNWGSNMYTSKLVRAMFGITCEQEDGSIQLFHCVDALLADGIRNLKNGKINEFNEEFKGWIYTAIGHIDDDQVNLIQSVWNAVGAYSTEQILLQCIMDVGMPHTPEQERRLVFLRENQNMLNQDLGKYTPVIGTTMADPDGIQDQQILIYDHRFHSWSTNDVEKYFKSLTLADKKHTVAAVVDKWAKNVTLQGMKWDNNVVTEIVRDTVIAEFGDTYTVSAVKAGVVVDDEVDSTDAIFIQASVDNRYPDICLLIVGEPMTRTQIHLSILILAVPEQSDDSNAKLLKRIIAVKEKHNPRLDTYIETFKSIITERVNRWIIDMNANQGIY